MTRMPFASKRARVVIALLIVAAAFVWWIDRSRVHDHGGPPEPRDHANAARSALWEIRTAQELFAAEHDGRYAATLGELDGAELARRLEPSGGVTASVVGDSTGAWYAAEVGHERLPGWRCRFATEEAPDARSGDLAAGEEVCDPLP